MEFEELFSITCATMLCPRPTRSIKSIWQASSRALFTLPDLSNLSPWGPETQTYREQKLFPYNQKQLYDIVSDVGSYPRFVPFCTGSRILDRPIPKARTADSEPFSMDAELTVGFLAFKESYVSKVTCRPFESVEAVASSSTPLFKTLSTTWRFQPGTTGSRRTSALLHDHDTRNNSTLVTLDLAYAFANPMHAAVSSTFFGQVSKLMVKAFEDRCLEVYGSGRD